MYVTKKVSRWAGAAATLCAVHCVVAAALVIVLPALAVTEAVETWLMAGVAVVAVPAAAAGLLLHGRAVAAGLVVLGLSFWWVSLVALLPQAPEWITSVTGSLMVAAGLFWNSKLLHTRGCSVRGQS